MAGFGADKDTKRLIRTAEKHWGVGAVSLTKGNHVKFVPPQPHQIIIGSLTGSITSQRKLKSSLKKAGLPV